MSTIAVFNVGDEVVLRRGKRNLFALVIGRTIEPVGDPGPNRYRYRLAPARFELGQPKRIAAFHPLSDVRGSRLEHYLFGSHKLDEWKAL